jgi:alkylated DNA nucleotide flippase Atl1
MKKLIRYREPLFAFLESIPKGRITTYAIAARFIDLKNPRNIGWILRQNRDPDKIPCYKVIKSDGTLAKGYKFGGLEEQKKRLESERILFDSKGKVRNFKNLVFGNK